MYTCNKSMKSEYFTSLTGLEMFTDSVSFSIVSLPLFLLAAVVIVVVVDVAFCCCFWTIAVVTVDLLLATEDLPPLVTVVLSLTTVDLPLTTLDGLALLPPTDLNTAGDVKW